VTREGLEGATEEQLNHFDDVGRFTFSVGFAFSYSLAVYCVGSKISTAVPVYRKYIHTVAVSNHVAFYYY
jgi:hypothetical protein